MSEMSETLKQAQQHLKAKRPAAAIQVLQPYTQRYPQDIEALNLLGHSYYEVKQYALAESTYLSMWSVAPQDFRPMYGMGVTLQKMGRSEEAWKWFNATLVTNPGFERASARLAELHGVAAARPPAQFPAGPAGPKDRRRMTTMVVPEDEDELERYKRTSRARARIDTMNQHWYGIPGPVRALQIIIAVAVLIGFIAIISRAGGR